jgi:hypothetical protein
MNKYFSILFLFTTICLSFNCFGYEPISNQSNSCIKELRNNKMYLNPSTAYVADNGIFININGEMHAFDHLEMDDNGVYINLLKANNYTAMGVGTCNRCGDVTIWGWCTNEACPTKRRD